MGEGTRNVAVIFLSERTGRDEAGYARAAASMSALAAEQPGYLGERSARTPGGLGITISYWMDEPSAIAWRDEPRHASVREAGRERWYLWYRVEVATVDRAYEWSRA